MAKGKDIVRMYKPDFYNYAEVAYHLRCSERQAKKLYYDGEIGASRHNGKGHPLFLPEEIREYVMRHYQPSLKEKAEEILNDVS